MGKKTDLEAIYAKYKLQIDSIIGLTGGSMNKGSIVVSWLYGGTSEGWRKFLPGRTSNAIPKEVKELFQNFKSK